MEVDSTAGAIFNVFYTMWQTRVSQERLPVELLGFIGRASGGLASRLIDEDPVGWFENDGHRKAVLETFERLCQC